MENLLILHGWGSCAQNWQQVKELLENKGLKVLVPDLPGFGENPPPSQSWLIDDYVDWVKDYSEKQNISPFFLLGHSFGGRIAIKFAAKYPEKLQGLILASAAGLTKRKSFKNFVFFVLAKLGKLVFPQLFFKKIIYKLAGSRDYFAAQGAMKETMKKIISEDLKPYLPKITTNTLIVWGAQDKLTPLADAYLIKKEIKNSVLEVIPNIGHRIRLEAPDILVQRIIEFIGRRDESLLHPRFNKLKLDK